MVILAKGSLNDPYTMCIARLSPKLLQSGPEVTDSPNALYAICMTETSPDA